MSDVSLYTNRSSYASEINSFDNNQDVAHKEQQSEVEQAGLDVVSQVETQPTNNDVTSEPAKAAPLIQPSTSTNVDAAQAADSAKVADGMQEADGAQASKGKSDDISAETKANLSSYLSKSCDMYVSHNSQARDNASDMNALLKGVATNPLAKITLSDGLQEQVNNAVAQKSVGTLPGGEKVLNAQHNLEAFFQIALDGDSTVHATCGANSVSYVANLMASMSNSKECSKVCSDFMQAAFPYLACENATEAKNLQGKLEQAMSDLQKAAQSGTEQDKGLAQVISNFTNELISQKNDSLEILGQSYINCSIVDIADVNNAFAMGQDAKGNASVVSPAVTKLSSLGAIASGNAERITREFNRTAFIANKALDFIKNNDLDEAKANLSSLGIHNKEAQGLVQSVYDQQVNKQANKLLDHILTPKSERKAQSKADSTNVSDSGSSAAPDISKFTGERSADLYALLKDLKSMAYQNDNNYQKLARMSLIDSDNPVKDRFRYSQSLTMHQDVFNQTISMLKDKLYAHEGLAEVQKQQLKNIEESIAKLQKEIDELKPDEAAVKQATRETLQPGQFYNPDLSKQEAKVDVANKKVMLQNEINNNFIMMASVLAEGMTQYVNDHLSGEDLAKITLADFGIDYNNPLGGINGGVSGLINSTTYSKLATHALGMQNKDAPEHILRGVVNEINGNSPKALKVKARVQALDKHLGRAQSRAQGSDQGVTAGKEATVAPIDSNAVAKELMGKKGLEAADQLHNSGDDKVREQAFNVGRRVVGSYAALTENFGALAHNLGVANHQERYAALAESTVAEPNSAAASAAATTAAAANTAQDPSVISANNEMARTEMEELFDLIAQEDNSQLCEHILNTAFAAQDSKTLDDLTELLDGIAVGYDHNKEQANRLANTKAIVEQLSILNTNIFFKELGSPNSPLNSISNPAMDNLKSAYNDFASDHSCENMLKLSVALHNVKPEDITLDVQGFMEEAQAKLEAQNSAQSSQEASVPGQSKEQIAQDLCDAKTAQLTVSLSLLSSHGEHLVDTAYAKFQLDNNLKLSSREKNEQNKDFFAMIEQVATNDIDAFYLKSFMVDGVMRSDALMAKAINTVVDTMVNHAKLPTVDKMVQNIKPDLAVTQERNNILSYYFDNYATPELKAAIASLDTHSISQLYKLMEEHLAKSWGSNPELITIGLAKGLEDNFAIKVDDKSSLREHTLAKNKVQAEQVIKYVSDAAIKKNEGETHAAAIRMSVSFACDNDFSEVDISKDLVAKYLGLKESSQTTNAANAQATTSDLSKDELNLFLALQEAIKGNQAIADSASLVRGLYKEYQASHREFDGVDFNQLKPNEYQSMLDFYYGKFGMKAPNDLSICGPRNNYQPMSREDKAKAMECLSKAVCKNNDIKLNQDVKKDLEKHFKTVIDVFNNTKGVRTEEQQKKLKDAFGAIYTLLSNDQDLLKVCDFVMMNKSVTNSLQKDQPMSTGQTEGRMLAKIFNLDKGKIHDTPNKLGLLMSSQFGFASVDQNYIDSNDLKTKSVMIKKGQSNQIEAIKKNQQSNALYNAGIHMAVLDVAELYGKTSTIAFVKEHLGAFVKSSVIKDDDNKITGASALNAKLPLSEQQIKTLESKGVKVTTVKLDAKVMEIPPKLSSAKTPSDANANQIELKVYEDSKGNTSVVFHELLGASLATHINVKAHNDKVLQSAEELNIPKDAAGNYRFKVPGLVKSQEIANGIMDVALRDPDFAMSEFLTQARLNANVNKQQKLDLAKEHIDNFIEAVKTNSSYSEKRNATREREAKKLESENIGLLSDVLFSIDDNTALTFNKEKKLNLLSFSKEADVGVAEASIEAKISASIKDGFCITKENGTYKFTVSKELALEMDAAFSLGIEAKKEGLPKDSAVKAQAGVDVEAGVSGSIGGAVTFEFKNEEEAAVFMHNMMMHSVARSELNGATLEGFLGGEGHASVEVSAQMVLITDNKKEEGGDDRKAAKYDGLIARQAGFATENKDDEGNSNNSKVYGVAGNMSFAIEGKGKQTLINEPNYHGYKCQIAGSIVVSASIAAGNLGQEAVNQISANIGTTLQYDIETVVKANNLSDIVTSGERHETYKINFDNDLTSALALQGVPNEVVAELLKSHKSHPISEISFNCELKQGLDFKLNDPELKNKANYNVTSVTIKYVDDKVLSSASAGVVEISETLNTQKSITAYMSFLSNAANSKALSKALANAS